MEEKEHKKKLDLILTETTGISIAVVALLISVAIYIVMIKGATEANSRELGDVKDNFNLLRKSYIEHTRITDENISTIKQDVGEMKGMMKILIKDKDGR